ncbi:MAG: NUDIX domain-containing protein [Pseudohongiellaceae bacterium]
MSEIPLHTSAISGVLLKRENATSRMLLLKRKDAGYWCHIAGHLEAGETGWQAMLREFREETGYAAMQLFSADYIEQFYEPAANRIRLVPVFVAFWPQGQELVLSGEHTEYRWCSLEEAKALAKFPNQRAAYQHVWENFVMTSPDSLLLVKLQPE